MRCDTPLRSPVPALTPAKMLPMARPAGTPQPRAQEPLAQRGVRVKLYGYVTREHYEKARTAAYSCGMSLGAYLTHLIEADEIDEAGRPYWAATEMPNAEELPIAM